MVGAIVAQPTPWMDPPPLLHSTQSGPNSVSSIDQNNTLIIWHIDYAVLILVKQHSHALNVLTNSNYISKYHQRKLAQTDVTGVRIFCSSKIEMLQVHWSDRMASQATRTDLGELEMLSSPYLLSSSKSGDSLLKD